MLWPISGRSGQDDVVRPGIHHLLVSVQPHESTIGANLVFLAQILEAVERLVDPVFERIAARPDGHPMRGGYDVLNRIPPAPAAPDHADLDGIRSLRVRIVPGRR